MNKINYIKERSICFIYSIELNVHNLIHYVNSLEKYILDIVNRKVYPKITIFNVNSKHISENAQNEGESF